MTMVRSRNFYVLLLCGIAIVGCFLWWGRLPVENSLRNSVVGSMIRKSGIILDSEEHPNPPPYVLQSNVYAGDDQGNDDDNGGTNGANDDAIIGELVRESINTNNNDSSIKKKPKNGTTTPKDPFANKPKMVWLMSYPNSGTSYTMMMAARASNRAMATNYGREVTQNTIPNTPLYEGHWEGPYYRPNHRPLPRDYIMVKTHCGGRCVLCGPQEYIEERSFFFQECTRGSGLFPNATTITGKQHQQRNNNEDIMDDGFQKVHYDFAWVQKAIHLIRSPFDNIVSRFHLERKHYEEHQKTNEVERYPNNATGFQRWCWDVNQQFGPRPQDKASLLPKDLVQQMQDVPCHGEFFKYTQWHNHAFDIMQQSGKPTLVLHYEDYERDWNATTQTLFEFLHLTMIGTQRPFTARHDYGPYFTPAQRRRAMGLVQRLATPSTWQQVERYFETIGPAADP